MKRFLSIFLALLLCVPHPVAAADISARYAVAMDMQTGRILYAKNADESYSMASTTKIMTAVVALENGNLSDVVTVSESAAGTEGSSIWLEAGEHMTLEDLLYGLLLASGNDAAVAIAEHVGGSVEAFARMMTEKAHAIGAQNTAFQNPNGLDAEGHYTTAADLARITRYAMQNETFAQMVATKTKTISWEGKNWGRTLSNHNKLLSLYEGCIGVKTGYTKKTGRCLVSAAQRDGFGVIVVTLAAPDDWNDHQRLYDEMFASYKPAQLPKECYTVAVENAEKPQTVLAEQAAFTYFAKDGEACPVEKEVHLPERILAPVTKGSYLGEVIVRAGDEILASIPLEATEDLVYYEEKTYANSLRRLFGVLLKTFGNFG